jgi:hypothetical protein
MCGFKNLTTKRRNHLVHDLVSFVICVLFYVVAILMWLLTQKY